MPAGHITIQAVGKIENILLTGGGKGRASCLVKLMNAAVIAAVIAAIAALIGVGATLVISIKNLNQQRDAAEKNTRRAAHSDTERTVRHSCRAN